MYSYTYVYIYIYIYSFTYSPSTPEYPSEPRSSHTSSLKPGNWLWKAAIFCRPQISKATWWRSSGSFVHPSPSAVS